MLALLTSQAAFGGSPSGCTDEPVVNAGWHELPAALRFPCDAQHLIVVRDYAAFLKNHPAIASNDVLRENGRHAIGLTLSATWPIYINLDGHRVLPNRFDQGIYHMAYAMAGILVHERVHAMGTLSESAAMLEEYRLAEVFQMENKLTPLVFNFRALHRNYVRALVEELRMFLRVIPH